MRLLTLCLFLVFSISLVAQDEPCDAIQLECNVSAVNGTFDGYTLDTDYPMDCPTSGGTGGTVWFTFESEGEQRYLFYSDLFNDLQSEHHARLYRGNSCEELIQLAGCRVDEYFVGFFPEGTYYVQLRQRSSDPDQNNFSAGVICADVPANDTLCDAFEIECGQVYSDLLVGATESLEDGFSSVFGSDGGDVWFKLEADSSTTYDFIGKNGQVIGVFLATDTCSEVTRIWGGTNVSGVVADGTLYVYVAPYRSDPTNAINYRLEVQCSPTPENSFACDAITLTGTEGSVTALIDDAASDFRPCSNNIFTPSRWYKYQADVDGELDLSACGFNIDVQAGFCDDFQCLGLVGTYCPSSPLTVVGSPCSDGTPLTYNDVITVDCECIGDPIPPGTLCQNAIPITQNPLSINYYNPTYEPFLPFYHTINDIPPFLDSLGSGPFTQGCYAAKDVVFSFTPEVDKFVDITASITDSNVEPNITILTGCPFTTAHVAEGCGTENFFVKKIENFHALADTTYYILIDGQPQLSGFDFNVDPLIQVVQKTFCPDLAAFQFDPCDDGNPNTTGETINEDCECEVDGPQPGDFCQNAIPIQPTSDLFGSPLNLNTEELTNSPFDYCLGSGQQRVDTWLEFEILSSVMAIKVQGEGDFDAVVEVWKNGCNGFVQNQLACQNDKGPGQAEIVILDEDLIIGNTLKLRVYHTSNVPPQNKNFSAAVTFVPKLHLIDDDCVNDMYALSDTLRIDVSEFSLPVKNWIFAFKELEAPFQTYFRLSPNGKKPGIRLNQVPPLELGRSYDVRVRPIFNGGVEGDFGEACAISITEGSEIGLIDVSSDTHTEIGQIALELFPNPANGSEVSISLTSLSSSESQILIRVYDLVGKQVLFEQFSSGSESALFSLNIEDLTSGVYTISAQVDGFRTSRKLLVE